MQTNRTIVIASFLAFTGAAAAQTVFSASGLAPASIQPTVDAFRTALGAQNGNNPGSVCAGRREINWDGVPDTAASPNAFPGDFFNANTPGRARGVVFSTPGTQFQVSARLSSGVAVEFGNINPNHVNEFEAFSPERLFASLGSVVTVIDFFVPGTNVPATSRGFGSVFTGVDQNGSATIELFDAAGVSLGVHNVRRGPVHPETLSFLGISYEQPVIASVKITSGTVAIDGQGGDFVAMDDFIYGEPVSICRADCDANGTLDIFDFLCFQNAFDAQTPCGDFDRDGQFAIWDFLGFQNAYDAGCGN